MNSAEYELKRLKALRDYNIINTTTDEDLDLITKLASRVCQVPITLMNLVDHTKTIFKSNIGLDANECDRKISFCDIVKSNKNSYLQ